MHDREPFCANPRCVLHVAPGDANVEGHGEWATLPNGRMFSRERVGEVYFCHVCAEDPDNPPLRDLLRS